MRFLIRKFSLCLAFWWHCLPRSADLKNCEGSEKGAERVEQQQSLLLDFRN